MIAQIKSEIVTGEISGVVTDGGVVVVGFKIEPQDLERESSEDFNRRLLGFLRSLPSDVLGRFRLESKECFESLPEVARGQHFGEMGHSRKQVFMFLEMDSLSPFARLWKRMGRRAQHHSSSASDLKRLHDLLLNSGIPFKALSIQELKAFGRRKGVELMESKGSVISGTSHIGVIRLKRPSASEINEDSLAECLMKAPKPYAVTVTVERKSEVFAKSLIERRIRQTEGSKRLLEETTRKELDELSLDLSREGTQVLEYEFLIEIERSSENELREALSQAQAELSEMGEFIIETYGVAPSFVAAQMGQKQHVTLYERDHALSLFLPVRALGEVKATSPVKRGLPLKRQDGSVYQFDLFSPEFQAFNTLIVGSSGKGKSVLCGLLTQALLNDPNVSIIKVDVGGSHSKECELYEGREYRFQLNHPSGLNPFEIVQNETLSVQDKVQILSRFILVLINDPSLGLISKQMRSEIEQVVDAYVSEGSEAPSLQDFYNWALSLPRRDLLRRWVKGGVYQAAFMPLKKSQVLESRLNYYNFREIFQASDPEFAQAGLAAVLASFNALALMGSQRRIVLICDEMPFFIKNCFDFFKFSTANVRKYGHAVVLIGQLSSDFVVGDDPGIIENSPQRFFFSVDGDHSLFQERFSLSDRSFKSIQNLSSIPGRYSQVLFQGGGQTRRLQVEVTKEEYWRLTTTRVEQEKIERLRLALPELSMKEAISCLARV